MTRRLPHLRRQLKSDNRGASLVTVVVIAALIIVMATVLLSVVLLNYYMKLQNVRSQENFYSAESAMEEIRMGLVVEASQASAIAYTQTLTNYNDLTETEKTESFQKTFFEQMQTQLKDGTDKEHYDCALLASFLKEDGATLETPQDGISNALDDKRLEAGERCLVLRGVSVSYTDEEDNYSVITTDIDIIYPDIDFSKASSMDNILCYAIIAGESTTDEYTGSEQRMSFVVQGDNKVDVDILGNVYLGTANTLIDKNAEVRFSNTADATGYITGADLNLDRNATVTIDGMETWLQNINIASGSAYTASNGESYLQNDLVLNGSGTNATLSGSLYAFGNPDAVRAAQCYEVDRAKGGQVKTALENNVADYSSSIIVNGGTGTSLDLSRLQNLMLAGTSYINTQKHYTAYSHSNQNSSVQTGQSVMTTSDQRAYLVPAELLGENPMTVETYNELKNSIMEEHGYTDESEIKSTDWVNFDAAVPELGKSLNALGVTGIQKSAIQINGAGTSLYYFFMSFDDQAKRNAFMRDYYNNDKSHSNKLVSNISIYAPGGLHMPGAVSNALSFYLEGNALSSDGDLIISDTLEKKTEDILTREISFTDMYAGLLADLNKDYQSLTKKQKQNTLFDNIMDEEAINGAAEYYVSENGIGAVVTSADISVSAANSAVKKKTVKDKNGNYHSDATISLIISKGNVTVDQDFEGLIFCEGTIEITSGCTQIKQDATKASIAFFQAQTEAGKYPAQYLENETYYVVGGIGDAQDEKQSSATIKLLDYVKYSNWEKY